MSQLLCPAPNRRGH